MVNTEWAFKQEGYSMTTVDKGLSQLLVTKYNLMPEFNTSNLPL